jgi:hypothetical protein
MNARDYERARSALAFIPPDDRDMWVSMGMAIKDGFGDEGFDLWDQWSRQSDRYDERDARDVWRSLKAGGGITLGTLFHEAKARGWRDDGTYHKPTPEEIEARRREAAERAAKEEREERFQHEAAAAKAAEILAAATGDPAAHPYAVKKQVPFGPLVRRGPWPQRGWADALLVPIYGVDGGLWSIEAISTDGDKDFLAGGRISGGFYPFNKVRGAHRVLIGEGLASVAACVAADPSPAAAALSASNLKAVALAVRELAPAAAITLVADNDLKPDGSNPGLTGAMEAARAVERLVAIPELGHDMWNTWAGGGVEAVQRVIADAKAPGVEESRLRAVEIYVLSGDPPTQRARPQADILIDIGLNVSKALFFGDDDRAYAVIRDRSKVWGVASRRFREWLRGCYFTRVGKGANANSVRDAIDTISARAQFSGDKRKVFLRTAEANGKIYIDLADDEWRAIEIDAGGWRVLYQSPVMFTRRGSPAPLPAPKPGGSMSDLWPFLNVPEKYRPLVAGFQLAALHPVGPYPILLFQGEQGTAKSTVARIVRSLCDPSRVPLRPPTRDERDFLVGAVGNWCVCVDNVSDLQPWMSDASAGSQRAVASLPGPYSPTAMRQQSRSSDP